ncbi:hypothetical protein ABT124_16000 [Streptomyces sp. NPDC001982]|uniref:hypothetical protein n=1 Tax=Streptomyces sp. NPDC001982 TaxID=3154405 RepID=UPI00333361AC
MRRDAYAEYVAQGLETAWAVLEVDMLTRSIVQRMEELQAVDRDSVLEDLRTRREASMERAHRNLMLLHKCSTLVQLEGPNSISIAVSPFNHLREEWLNVAAVREVPNDLAAVLNKWNITPGAAIDADAYTRRAEQRLDDVKVAGRIALGAELGSNG